MILYSSIHCYSPYVFLLFVEDQKPHPTICSFQSELRQGALTIIFCVYRLFECPAHKNHKQLPGPWH